MLTSIDVNSSSIVHVYRESLGDKGLFSSPNILQIAKKKTMYVFFEYSLNANSSPAQQYCEYSWAHIPVPRSLPENPCTKFD